MDLNGVKLKPSAVYEPLRFIGKGNFGTVSLVRCEDDGWVSNCSESIALNYCSKCSGMLLYPLEIPCRLISQVFLFQHVFSQNFRRLYALKKMAYHASTEREKKDRMYALKEVRPFFLHSTNNLHCHWFSYAKQ